MCYYAPFGAKEMWDWHTTVTIKKQQTLEQVLYRVPDHCIRAVKTATSYTDRIIILYTIALMSTNPLDPSRKRRRRVHARRRPGQVPPAHVNYVTRRTSQRIQRDVLIPALIRLGLVTSTKE